jgi:hypothetical protein
MDKAQARENAIRSIQEAVAYLFGLSCRPSVKGALFSESLSFFIGSAHLPALGLNREAHRALGRSHRR